MDPDNTLERFLEALYDKDCALAEHILKEARAAGLDVSEWEKEFSMSCVEKNYR